MQEGILQEESKIEKKSIKIGEFKPKKEFKSLVANFSSKKIRLVTDSAFIRGSYFSGLGMDGVVFKLSICSQGTVDFEEVDTNVTTQEQRKRFVEDICDLNVTGYANKFIVSNLEFYTKDMDKCYLEIEHQKPIDRLADILSGEDSVDFEKLEISEKSKSFLDDLFSENSEIVENKSFGIDAEESDQSFGIDLERSKIKEVSTTINRVKESFDKMKEDKIKELKDRVEKKIEEVKKEEHNLSTAEKNLHKSSDELKVLNTRLESMVPNDPENGYCFFVSEERKTGIEPDEKMVEVVEKISPILNLRSKVVIDMITKGFHIIKFAKVDSLDKPLDDNDKELAKELHKIYDLIRSVDLLGNFTINNLQEIKYSGDLTYHELVDKMIRRGFVQIPEFNKLSGSNSYENVEVLGKKCEEGSCSGKKDGSCGENCRCGNISNRDLIYSSMKIIKGFKQFEGSKDEFQKKADEILDKISDIGIDSLSEEEKIFLKNFSSGKKVPFNKIVVKNTQMENSLIDMNDPDTQDALNDFEETYGYPVGSDIIFTTSILSDGIATDCISLAIQPKSYWDNEHCQYDGHLGELIDLPEEFEELAESTFQYSGPITECIEKLIILGLKFSPDFQSFMEEQIPTKTRINGILVSDYIRQTFPNSIV